MLLRMRTLRQQTKQTTRPAKVEIELQPVAWLKGNITLTRWSTHSPTAATSATTNKKRLQRPASRAQTTTI